MPPVPIFSRISYAVFFLKKKSNGSLGRSFPRVSHSLSSYRSLEQQPQSACRANRLLNATSGATNRFSKKKSGSVKVTKNHQTADLTAPPLPGDKSPSRKGINWRPAAP